MNRARHTKQHETISKLMFPRVTSWFIIITFF
jgi:hypothetical protein